MNKTQWNVSINEATVTISNSNNYYLSLILGYAYYIDNDIEPATFKNVNVTHKTIHIRYAGRCDNVYLPFDILPHIIINPCAKKDIKRWKTSQVFRSLKQRLARQG